MTLGTFEMSFLGSCLAAYTVNNLNIKQKQKTEKYVNLLTLSYGALSGKLSEDFSKKNNMYCGTKKSLFFQMLLGALISNVTFNLTYRHLKRRDKSS